MKLKINGKEQELENGTNILGFLESKGIKPQTVIVELNYEMPQREEWGNIVLKENDNLEVLKFIGGG